MVETVSQSSFNFSSDYTPYSFSSTMRTCYANNKTTSVNSSGSSQESSNSGSSVSSTNSSLDSNSTNNQLQRSPNQCRRSSCNEMYLRNNLDQNLDQHHCNNKRCSNTITTTCVNSTNKTNKPKLQLTTTTIEDNQNLSCCTTHLSTPQSNGMISQKHQFNFDQFNTNHFLNRMASNSLKQKRSESFGLFNRQNSELNDNNNNLLNNSFDDNNDCNSNNSEDDMVFNNELSSSPSFNQTAHHQHQTKSPRQTFVLCKRCGSNSSLASFSSISSSVSSTNNLNQYTLTNCTQAQCVLIQDNLINNLTHSLNQTFNFPSSTTPTNLSTPPFNRSRHNSINSLTLTNNIQPDKGLDKGLQELNVKLQNIFSN